jgi:hypothetical protein
MNDYFKSILVIKYILQSTSMEQSYYHHLELETTLVQDAFMKSTHG